MEIKIKRIIINILPPNNQSELSFYEILLILLRFWMKWHCFLFFQSILFISFFFKSNGLSLDLLVKLILIMDPLDQLGPFHSVPSPLCCVWCGPHFRCVFCVLFAFLSIDACLCTGNCLLNVHFCPTLSRFIYVIFVEKIKK